MNREIARSEVEGGVVGNLNKIAVAIKDECLIDEAGACGCVAVENAIPAANAVVCVPISRPPARQTSRGWIATISRLGSQSGFDGREQ
jgi:hypothetical protein